MPKIGVTGTRFLTNPIPVFKALDELSEKVGIEEIISGHAKGVDTLCEKWAAQRNIKIDIHKPNYDKYGKGAPFIRNSEIVENCDMLIAFPLPTDHPNAPSRGTFDTMAKAIKAKKIVERIDLSIEDFK
jgi:hypothetical protein